MKSTPKLACALALGTLLSCNAVLWAQVSGGVAAGGGGGAASGGVSTGAGAASGGISSSGLSGGSGGPGGLAATGVAPGTAALGTAPGGDNLVGAPSGGPSAVGGSPSGLGAASATTSETTVTTETGQTTSTTTGAAAPGQQLAAGMQATGGAGGTSANGDTNPNFGSVGGAPSDYNGQVSGGPVLQTGASSDAGAASGGSFRAYVPGQERLSRSYDSSVTYSSGASGSDIVVSGGTASTRSAGANRSGHHFADTGAENTHWQLWAMVPAAMAALMLVRRRNTPKLIQRNAEI